MNGARVYGPRKSRLIEVNLNKWVTLCNKKGLNAGAFLKEFHGIHNSDSFLTINTKRISGIISELAQWYRANS